MIKKIATQLLFAALTMTGCNNDKSDCQAIDSSPPSNDTANSEPATEELTSTIGCLGPEHSDRIWPVDIGKLFCVDIGTVGGNANFELSVWLDGEGITLIDDIYEEPPEDAFDMPTSWSQMYKATTASAVDVVIYITSFADNTTTEHFRIQLDVVE